ncbi:MAG: hypothetical protein HOY71_25825 [Nonomuraea sp.]|nr:hypothetical protein [Nonomuraea sp.]
MISRITAGLVLLVAGCGLPTAAPVAPADSPKARIEYARAECMRDRGFHYEPFLPTQPPVTAEQQKEFDGDYALMRATRERIGYRVFSGFVYRTDPTAGGMDAAVNDEANGRSMGHLSATQMEAYDAAGKACLAQAVEKVLHRRVTGQEDLSEQMWREIDREKTRVLDGDPQLVALARAYAACMRGKGYEIPSERPSRISWAEPDRFRARVYELGRQQQGPKAEAGLPYYPTLSEEEAKPYLREEIASALDDLECGKEFFPVYLPRQQAVADPIVRAWGMD